VTQSARDQTGPDGRRPAISHDDIAERLGSAAAEVAALKALTLAFVSRTARTGNPGADGSMIRLFYAELAQRIKRLAVDILGRSGLVAENNGSLETPVGDYLYSFAHTIGGGTSEIQRNIIAQRVLGLSR
jgi:alkylation response protein AidB-like acyl-CoA dehydrogenase